MDIVLEFLDTLVFDHLYAQLFPATTAKHIPESISKTLHVGNFTEHYSTSFLDDPETYKHFYGLSPVFFQSSPYMNRSMFGRDNIFRQLLSLWITVTIFGWILYLSCATFSYTFIFDKRTFNHPKYLKNQVKLEIKLALSAIPVMSIMTIPWFVLEIRGHGKLFWDINQWGMTYFILQFPLFIMFTDCGIYFLHRWLHVPWVYKHLHKPHHKWIICTPFASHSFHPIDGYFQSLPYHIFPFFFPLHKIAYLCLFCAVNFWTVLIHDGKFLTRNPWVNGTACHTVHHLYFNYNYGQFTTLWDWLGGSYRAAERELWDEDLRNTKTALAKTCAEMETIRMEVEEEDDQRDYVSSTSSKLD